MIAFLTRKFVALRRWREDLLIRRAGQIAHLDRWVMLAALLVGIYAMLLLPLDLFLWSLKTGRQVGTGDDAILYLTTGGRIGLTGALMLMIPLSAVIGGFARTVFDLFTSRWTLLVLVTGAGGLFAYISHVYRITVSQIDVVKGDHGMLVAFLTVWLFLIGYICKVPWDRTRDRWDDYCKQQRNDRPF